MAESNRDIADQFESRILQLNSRRILLEGKHRWLRPDEICEVLRNPNGVAISEEPAIMPPSGSTFLFDKKVQRHFRNDGYKWKKAKDGRTKEGHEKLKVEGLDTLHCYYAHGEEDQNFQRRSYWMLEENLSHMVLVHYRDVKGEKRKARYIEEIESAEGVQHSCETDEITPNSEMDSFASSSFNPTYNHQASSGLPTLPKFQHSVAEINADIYCPLIRTNCKEREVEEAISSCFNPTNLQMRSQAIDTASSSGVYTSACEETQSGGGCTLSCVFPKNFKTAYIVDDDIGWSFYNDFPTGVSETEYTTRFEMNNFDSTRFTDTTSFYSANSSNFGDDDTACFSSSVAVEPSHASLGKRQRNSTASKEGKSKATPHATIEEVDNEKDEEEEGNDISQVRKRPKVTCGQKVDSPMQIPPWLELVLGDDLFLDSTASEEGKSKAKPHATTEEVDNEKDEEEEGNDISQVRKRPKVTCGQKSNSVAPSSDDEEATPVQQGLIVPLAVRTAPPQVQEFNSAIQQGEVIAGNNPAASDVAMTIDTAITDGATNDATALSQNATQIPSLTTVIVSNRGLNNQQADQSQPSVPQPTATVGSAISATTNMTAAPESSNPALVQSRPTSDTNQDFVQDVDSQEKETEPTSFVPENGKGKIVVQRDVGTEKAQDLQPPVLQPTATTGVVISATTNAIAASESSNPALVQSEPTSIANEDFAQDVAESQEKETEPTSVELENGKSKAVVQNDFGMGKSHKFSEVVVMGSHKRLHELLDRASAPNTLASSCSSTPTIDSQAIATTRATLEMDFITMAGEVQRTHMISCIQSLVDSNCFPTGTRPMILAMLKQLEQFLAYSEAYSEYDMGKNLTDEVEATKQLLQPKVQFCDSKKREFLELEEKKMKIEARQAAILAEIHGAVKETEPIQAHLEKLLLQQDQIKENESNFKNILDIGDGLWTTLKSIIHRHLPT